MRYLSGTDTQMLYADAAHAQNVIAPIMVFDPSTAPGGKVDYEDVLEYFRARLHLSESFRERLVRSPFALDRPIWIRDPDFDIEYHVREIALPRPGTWEQFIAQVARLGARPLDMTRPPWECYVIYGLDSIEGFPEGSFATMLKLHHAAVDGVAGNELVTALMQHTPDEPPPAETDTWTPEQVPNYLRRLAYAGFQTVARPVASYRQFLRAATAAPRAMRQAARTPVGGRAATTATRFNRAISPHRTWDAARFHLADIKRIKNSIPGATVNDAAVAIVGGGLRRYLQAKNELPEATVSAIMPISVRPTSTQKAAPQGESPAPHQVSSGGGGNSFAMAVIPLRTDIADPLERLAAVHDSTDAAKGYGVDALTLMQATEALPGALIGTMQRALSRVISRTGRATGAHTIVTNVPGPRVPMYFCGARGLFMSGMAPVVDGMGLIIGVGSYVDEFFLCWTADREQIPDTAFFSECMQAEFEAALKAVEGK
jgi:diacylglycerol O-acyltransferase